MKRSYWRAVVAIPFLVLAVSSSAQAPTPEQLDAALNELIKLDPAAVAAKVSSLKEQVVALQAESDKTKADAAALEAKAAALTATVDSFANGITALQALLAPAAPAAEPTMPAEAAPASMAAEPAMAAPAVAAAPTVNFEEHIMPIFKARCMSCHNEDKKRGGLSLQSIASTMAGGGSGVVITAGQPDASRLLRLVMKTEEPFMPPSGNPLDEAQINLIREWIQQGAPATKDSKIEMKTAEAATAAPVFIAAAISDGPPPMPEVALTAATPSAHERKIVARAVAASPTAPLAAVGGDQQVLLYNTDTYQLLGALPFPEGDIYMLTFSVSGELLLAAGGKEGDSGAAVLWNVRKGDRAGQYGEGFDTVLAADVSPDHRMIAIGGPERKVRVYSVADATLLYTLESHTDWILALKFTPDGEVLATADRAGGLYLWQAANGRPVEQLQGHTGAINDLAYTLDSTLLASAGADGTVQIWDTWTYAKVRQMAAHTGAVLSVDVAPDGQMVTAGIDGVTKRWDAQGNNTATFAQQGDWVYQARFCGKGAGVLGGVWNGEIAAWNTQTGEQLAKLSTAP